MIEKLSGKVAYAVLSSGGFLGIGEEEHTIPWSKLTYDTNLGGYRTDITEEQLRGAPSFYRARDYDWSDRRRDQELHDYWRARYYWSPDEVYGGFWTCQPPRRGAVEQQPVLVPVQQLHALGRLKWLHAGRRHIGFTV
jgi:hypothetical protein